MHAPEQAFRLAALYAGLELEPGTSPPVLRRVPGWPRRTPGPADDPMTAPAHLQPIRNYLRFLGPATPKDVAGFLDTSVAVVKAHWPEDAVPVQVNGRQLWWLGGDVPDVDGSWCDCWVATTCCCRGATVTCWCPTHHGTRHSGR